VPIAATIALEMIGPIPARHQPLAKHPARKCADLANPAGHS
jgi:hypothetical protein